ncbi:MAG: hypothetical protein GC168_13455 [Candidatus Hydrogenedens sp.]|nr:hypothetical protein [Candidatus Hydrogenedens sp.]
MPFEIKERVPLHRYAKYPDLDNPAKTPGGYQGLAKVYYQTNLMVYMCGDLPYAELYGPMGPTVSTMIDRLTTLPASHPARDAFTELDKDVADSLNKTLGLLKDIKDVLDNNPTLALSLRDFFEGIHWADPPPINPTPMWSIADLWIKLDDLGNDFFCLPWARIQRAEDPTLVIPREKFAMHLELIGEFKMEDFYSLPRSDSRYFKLKSAILHGRLIRALSRTRTGHLTSLAGCHDWTLGSGGGGGGGSNNMVCSGGTCVTLQNSFCSVLPQGGCSAASG